MNRMFIAAATCAALCLTSSAPANAAPVRLEGTMGFVGGQRSLLATPFRLDEGEAYGIAATGPLAAAPYDNVTSLGLRYDVRVVVSYVRMTVGFDVPFTRHDTRLVHDVDLDGFSVPVTIEEIDPFALRFGLGGEYAFTLGDGPEAVTPFVDLLGTAQWTTVTARVDGSLAELRGSTFDLTVRTGVRFDLNEYFFVQLAGEAGVLGDVRWGAELSVGFALR